MLVFKDITEPQEAAAATRPFRQPRCADRPPQPRRALASARRRLAPAAARLSSARTRFASSISTASSRSTTPPATPPATHCCRRSRRPIRATCRAQDFAARIGGDEFVVAAPGLPIGQCRAGRPQDRRCRRCDRLRMGRHALFHRRIYRGSVHRHRIRRRGPRPGRCRLLRRKGERARQRGFRQRLTSGAQRAGSVPRHAGSHRRAQACDCRQRVTSSNSDAAYSARTTKAGARAATAFQRFKAEPPAAACSNVDVSSSNYSTQNRNVPCSFQIDGNLPGARAPIYYSTIMSATLSGVTYIWFTFSSDFCGTLSDRHQHRTSLHQ